MQITTAADRFLDSALTAWDNRELWTATAAEGLSKVDQEALESLCDETGEDYDTAETEVLAFVREKAAR